jgi:hypothetical protein
MRPSPRVRTGDVEESKTLRSTDLIPTGSVKAINSRRYP